MNAFYDSLKGTDRVLYKMGYDFHKKLSPDSTEEDAHKAGLSEIKRIGRLREQLSQPQDYVNVATGERFRCTEAEMMAKHA